MSGTFKRRHRRRLRPAAVAAAAVIICIAAAAVWALRPEKTKKPAAASGSTASSFAVQSAPSAVSQSSLRSSSGASSKAPSLSSEDKALLLLVNKDNPIPTGYDSQVTMTTIPASYYTSSDKDNQFDSRAASHLIQMLDDAKSQGIPLVIYSGHRTYDYQKNNYQGQVNKLIKQGLTSSQAQVQAANLVAPPGTSEHETGLACDIVGTDWLKNHSDLTAAFDQTKAYEWLNAHAVEYGFILRYPKGDEAVTKYDYEPWHYRYVGAANAKKIKDSGLCLEDYLQKYPVK